MCEDFSVLSCVFFTVILLRNRRIKVPKDKSKEKKLPKLKKSPRNLAKVHI